MKNNRVHLHIVKYLIEIKFKLAILTYGGYYVKTD